MPPSSADRNPVEELAEEFAARYRRGERPSLTEYVEKYPQHAEAIRELFPALVMMEQLKPAGADPTGAFEGRAESAEGRLPDCLGDYRILREVGRGGMGVVYEAEQVSLGRHVALKVLPPHAWLNQTYLERFRREAKAAAKLHHTNIVPVFGVGEQDGTHFYAMQYIPGEGLDKVLHDLRRLRRPSGGTAEPPDSAPAEGSVAHSLLTGRFAAPATVTDGEPHGGPAAAPAPRAEPKSPAALSAGGSEAAYYRSVARVGLQAAEALAYAHRQGVLHRDIKPSNLLLDAQGTVWITDFGLAKAEGTDELTQTGDIVGTLRFMAPERFDGHSLPQSDVYALGLTLYELLTLRRAFDDTNRGRLIEKVLHQPPVPPRRLDPHIPRNLETVVLKCVAKNPVERYPTAEALAEDLRRFLADRPVKARRASSAEQLWRWSRRNPAVASLLGAVAVLLVAVSAVSTFSAARMNVALGKQRQAEGDARRAEREARLREAEALVGEAHGIRYSRRPGQRFEALAALQKAVAIGRELGQPAEWYDRLRNEAIAALALPDIHITQSWDGLPPGTHWADVSPDFALYARTTKQGDCSIRRVADDTEVAHLPGSGVPASVRFGPGRRLAIVRGEVVGRCQLWDLSGPEPVLRLDQQQEVYPGDENFSRDGRLFVLHYKDGSMEVFATDTGESRYRLAPIGITQPWVRSDLHPTEPFLAAWSYYSPLLQIRDLRTGAAVVSLTLPWRGSGSCAWSPDGGALAVPDGDSGLIHLYAFDPATPTLRLTRTMQGGDAGSVVQFNSVGDRLVVRGWSGIVHFFDVHTGRLLFSTRSLTSTGNASLRFDLTGERLAAARVGERQERIGLWSVADAREYRVLVRAGSGPGPRHEQCAIHPDGRLAAQGFEDGLTLYDLDTGRELGFVKVPRGVGAVCFDGRGNLLNNGFAGLFRWPVRSAPAGPGRLALGPPERLPFPPGDRGIAASYDGRVIAQSMYLGYGMDQYAGGWILSPDIPRPRWVDAGTGMLWCDVSPDGRWVAFGDHTHKAVVNVYEAATGRRVWQSPDDGGNYCRFTPDGRWLLTSANDGARAYAVGTWESGPSLGLGMPWDASPDGLVVLGLADGVYRLVELATGRELARLEDPDQLFAPAIFTPDGTRLVVAAGDGLRVWDLRRIRAGLVKFGLDWDAPPYPAAADVVPGPLEVRIVGAELLDPQKMAEHEARQDVARLFFNPFDAEAHYRLGVRLLDARQPEPAHAHLTAALAFRPDLREARYQRARAAFCLKRWSDAAADATRYLDDLPDNEAARYLRAQALRLSRRFEEAVRDYTALIERHPQDPQLYEYRALCHEALGDTGRAKADREQAFAVGPRNPTALNNHAWHLLTGPDGQRDPARALQLIQDAVKKEPENATFSNTLGVAQYRNGLYREAVTTLEKSLAGGKGQFDAFDLFFLAMCHAQLGDASRAKDCFDRAVKWWDERKNLPAAHVEELKAFRAEAEGVLKEKDWAKKKN